MPESTLLRHCAPTLAGIKTGSLFTASYATEEELREDLEFINGVFADKGLVVTCLRYKKGTALIYVYRPVKLISDLKRKESRDILGRYGYDTSDHRACLELLSKRIFGNSDFPHEIGLFLGYPPEDVKGFIDNGAKGSKATGMWKVYGDVQEAETLFRKYRKCTSVYLSCWQKGTPISRLAVRMV